jgi:hypothetical protein
VDERARLWSAPQAIEEMVTPGAMLTGTMVVRVASVPSPS